MKGAPVARASMLRWGEHSTGPDSIASREQKRFRAAGAFHGRTECEESLESCAVYRKPTKPTMRLLSYVGGGTLAFSWWNICSEAQQLAENT